MRRLCWCRCKGGSALGVSFHLVVCGSARVLLERTHAQFERGGISLCESFLLAARRPRMANADCGIGTGRACDFTPP